MLSEPVLVVAKLARVFDDLGIRYVVGGSVASSLYGIPRATQDVDMVADVRLAHVAGITSALTGEFYVDADMIRDAITRRASFNVVHLATMFKADVFILQDDSWSREEMARARTEQIDIPEGKIAICFASRKTRYFTNSYGTGSATRSRIDNGVISSGCSRFKARRWIRSTSIDGLRCSTSWICFFARGRSSEDRHNSHAAPTGIKPLDPQTHPNVVRSIGNVTTDKGLLENLPNLP